MRKSAKPASRFSLIVPCAFAVDSSTPIEKWYLCVDIRPTAASLHLTFPDTPDRPPVELITSDFRRLSFQEIGICTLTRQSGPPVNIFFYHDFPNFCRFLLTLGGAGLLVPLRTGEFHLLSRPSFIPAVISDLPEHDLYNEICGIICGKCRSVNETERPFFDAFSPSCASAFHRSVRVSIRTTFSLPENRRQIVSDHQITCAQIYAWLKEIVPVRTGQFAKFNARTADMDLGALADEISEEARDYPADSLFDWNMRDLCVQICLASVAAGRSYERGNFAIAHRLALLLLGKSGVVEEAPKRLLSLTLDEFLFAAYLFFQKFVAADEDETREEMAEMGMHFLRVGAPGVVPYFYQLGLDQFEFALGWIPHLMANMFTEVWRLWFWAFRSKDWLRVFTAFVTAVAFLSVPSLVKAKPAPAELVDKWDQLTGNVQIAEALDVAVYFLGIAGEPPRSPPSRAH